MAQRRMFSNRIANSARFLQMPAEAQLLYFHMILRADDDGVVESYPLMKLLGVPADNFKLLVAKEFIRPLNEDQVIVVVDWLEHNVIRADRKVDSIYKHLLVEQCPDVKLIEPKPRADVEDNSKRLGGQSVDCPRTAYVRLGKDSIGKDSIGTMALVSASPSQEAKEFFNRGAIYGEIYDLLVANISEPAVRRELDKFVSYWTEPNKLGTKQRWQLQPTFDVKRRLRTWLERAGSDYQKSRKGKGIIL